MLGAEEPSAPSEADSGEQALPRRSSSSQSGGGGAVQVQRSSSSMGGSAVGAGGGAAGRLQLLWQPVLGLLQQYIMFPAESAAVLGMNQLHNNLLAAAPVLDSPGWQAAVLVLQAVCLQDAWAQPAPGTPNARPGSGSRSSSSLLAAAVAEAEAIRRRSRLAVLLQRVLDSMLLQRAAAMPGQVQLQLLDLLHRTVQAAAALNADAGRRAAAERALAAGAAVTAQQLVGGSTTWGPGGTAGEAPPEGLGPMVGVGAEDEDEDPAGGSNGSGWEHLRPALVRQEAEGGCLYIAALQRCMHSPTSSNGTEAAVAAESEARLAHFCLWVVQGAAERATACAGGDDGPPDAAAAGVALAAAALTASPGPGTPAAAGLGGGSSSGINPADQPWEDAVR